MTTAAPPDAAEQSEPELPLLQLSELPPAVNTEPALRDAVARLAAGTGPVAVDAERASGYRYGQRCYLVQLRREGSGTFLVDPIPFADLTALDAAIAGAEWVLHAASQDLPGLAEIGMRPRALFDTELAARLAGYERVGLATMVERVLGCRLEKGHSAADWSQRPLPQPLLRYAALDVEPLLALRDHLEAELAEQGKLEWAREEFAAAASAPPAPPRTDPWRRTSGLHRIRTPRQLAGIRALWEARDAIARSRDTAPGRVLPDTAIVDAVLKAPSGGDELTKLPVFTSRGARRHLAAWQAALASAAALPDSELPAVNGGGDGPPPTHRWAERDPAAAARLAKLRNVVAALAEAHKLPTENLLEPAVIRRLAWNPPAGDVAEAIRDAGAREWQVRLCAAAVAEALAD